VIQWVNIVSQQVLAIYNSGCRIYCAGPDSIHILLCQHTEVLC